MVSFLCRCSPDRMSCSTPTGSPTLYTTIGRTDFTENFRFTGNSDMRGRIQDSEDVYNPRGSLSEMNTSPAPYPFLLLPQAGGILLRKPYSLPIIVPKGFCTHDSSVNILPSAF